MQYADLEHLPAAAHDFLLTRFGADNLSLTPDKKWLNLHLPANCRQRESYFPFTGLTLAETEQELDKLGMKPSLLLGYRPHSKDTSGIVRIPVHALTYGAPMAEKSIPFVKEAGRSWLEMFPGKPRPAAPTGLTTGRTAEIVSLDSFRERSGKTREVERDNPAHR